MQYKLKISEDAKYDIDNISEYLKDYEIARDKVITQINNDILDLAFMPRIHKTLYKQNDKNTEHRRIVSENYIIIYKIEKNEIIILRIFSHKQDYLNPKSFILREESNIYKTIK